MKSAQALRAEILQLTRDYTALVHGAHRPGSDPEPGVGFTPGTTPVPYAGRVFTADEVEAAVRTTLDFWLTLGAEGAAFEEELAALLDVRYSLLTNSGSSANLLALSALTSPKIAPERRLGPGDEVITCAASFPTTVTPILQHGAVPVFLDNDPVTLNADCDLLEEAYVAGRTKAVVFAHALGNPFDLSRVLDFCRRRDLWLIEDNCDALGATYTLAGHPPRYTGSFGDLSSQSFYPPHHLTMGEGGAVNVVRESRLKRLVESYRDWGRDCWCPSGQDNTCGKRFGWQLGELPAGYDHKYVYSHLGYNLKPLDVQAAIGREQLKKLSGFGAARRANWHHLRAGLAGLEEFFDYQLPTHAKGWSPANGGEFSWDPTGPRTDPSWFGFLLLVKPSAPFRRTDLSRHLTAQGIGNRMLFGGNLLRQPAFVQLRRDRPGSLRVAGNRPHLPGADRIMNDALFVGVYPGLTRAMREWIVEAITGFCRNH